MKKAFSMILVIALLLSLCVPALAAENARPGAAWIDSDLYGTFRDRDEIRPQDDFAAAINREWAENVQIPAGGSENSARVEHELENTAAKIALLSGEHKDDPELTAMQNFYALLLDWDARNAAGYQELKPYIDDIMAISSIDELTAFYSDPNRNLLGSPLVETLVMADADDAFTNILHLCSPLLFSVMDSSFYTDEEDGVLRGLLRQDTGYMLAGLGYSEDEAAELFDRCVAFESNFAPAIDEYMQRVMRDGQDKATNNPVTLEEMDANYKNLPIRQIFQSLGYDLEGKVNVWMTGFLPMFDSLYTEENLENLKVWTMLQTLLRFQDYLDRETYEKGAYLVGSMSGVDSLVPDEQYALKTIYGLIPGMIDKLYAKYCFDPEIKVQMTELTRMMIDAYRAMLKDEVDWLTDETKAAAIEKLDNIKLHVCYPDVMPDFTDVKIPTAEEGGTLLKSVISILQHNWKTSAEKLHQKNDGTLWHHTVAYSELGACYMPSENSININAGICGGEYYDPSWPIERRLGGVCMVVGHEISHAFDTHGANFDKDGNNRDWWQPEDRQAFNDRVDKLVAYYSQIVPAPQLSDKPYGEDGARFIMGEAIADLASVKCLLSIARGIENFDYDMFFTQLARIQKVARYDAAENVYLETNNHPVDCFRCNVPLQNYDEFLETYGVKEGDGMYLAPEDRIRVW